MNCSIAVLTHMWCDVSMPDRTIGFAVLQSVEGLDGGDAVLLDTISTIGKLLNYNADVFIHQVPQNHSARVVPTRIEHRSKVRAKNWCKEDKIFALQTNEAHVGLHR